MLPQPFRALPLAKRRLVSALNMEVVYSWNRGGGVNLYQSTRRLLPEDDTLQDTATSYDLDTLAEGQEPLRVLLPPPPNKIKKSVIVLQSERFL
jgi:hypothetical protein